MPRNDALLPRPDRANTLLLATGLMALIALSAARPVAAQGLPGTVLGQQKISALAGGFGGVLHEGDHFGCSVVAVGDIDGDGVTDFAVGASGDDDGLPGPDPDHGTGAIWILFMSPDGDVRDQTKLSATTPELAGWASVKHFGSCLAAIGDLNGDGVPDLVDGDGYVLILFLEPDGSIASVSGIGALGFLTSTSVALVGLDPLSHVATLAVGSSSAASWAGDVWLLRVDGDGAVLGLQLIAPGVGGFVGPLHAEDFFGSAVTGLGDLDGNGMPDLAVGAKRDPNGLVGDIAYGAVWVLLLNPDLTVRAQQKITATEGGFVGGLGSQVWFGSALACLGDVDGDGVADLAVGAEEDFHNAGAAAVLMLRPDGQVKSHQPIANIWGMWYHAEFFGAALATVPDINGDGRPDVAVGVPYDDDLVGGGGPQANAGAIRLLAISGPPFAGWTDLGYGMPVGGTPRLFGSGRLAGNTPVQLDLRSAPKLGLGFLLVSNDVYNLPLGGGYVIPNPLSSGLVLPIVTSSDGSATLNGRWPEGLPTGTVLYMQAWFPIPAGQPFAYSNALAATQP